MKYCESCRVKNNWPKTMQKSHVACEICNGMTTCYENDDKLLHGIEKFRSDKK